MTSLQKTLFACVLLPLTIVGAVLSTSCKSDPTPGPRLSRKGEACLSTGDCDNGLSCMPTPGGSTAICVTGEFKVSATAKECHMQMCTQASDCCPTPSSSTQCTQWKNDCDQFGDAGASSSCRQYDQFCKCDATRYECDDGRCRSVCKDDDDCGSASSGLRCFAGKCAQCESDNDCSGDYTCLGGACLPPCSSDSECPSFNRCSSGKCVESGCKTDRECIAATRNVEAKCLDAKCVVPCQTDLECGNPKAYNFYSCINNQCVYTGCESDKDCALYYTGGSDAGLPSKTRAVCRDKK